MTTAEDTGSKTGRIVENDIFDRIGHCGKNVVGFAFVTHSDKVRCGGLPVSPERITCVCGRHCVCVRACVFVLNVRIPSLPSDF